MKRILWLALVLFVFIGLVPAASLADDAGVLSEDELNAWISQALQDSAAEQPSNAPVGEESLTEDGYAFLYSFATLYYDKPVLDQKSVLKGIAVTDEKYASPRGIKLGSAAQLLMDSYGWQNPLLMGDGSFATFYRLDDLPRAAYWSWAQHEGEALLSVQCAIHVNVAADRYTDAGLTYTLENGVVTGIRVYGLNNAIVSADVRKNLDTVMKVEAAGSGDEPMEDDLYKQPAAQGIFMKNDKPIFAENDLKFGGINYLSFTEASAKIAFGAVLNEAYVQDDTGELMLTTQRDGLELSYTISADGSRSSIESFTMKKDLLAGPRDIRIGWMLDQVLAAFACEGTGGVAGTSAVLYGDGVNAPLGLYEKQDENTSFLRYTATANQNGAMITVILKMTFIDEKLTELMIYSW